MRTSAIAVFLGLMISGTTARAGIVVPNSGFETPVLGTTPYLYNPTIANQGGAGWLFQGSTGITETQNIFGAPPSPAGGQVAFIQQLSSNTGNNASVVEQSLDGFTSDFYRVSFYAAGRAANNGPNTFQVLIDSTVLTFGGSTTITPGTQGFQLYTSDAVAITAGSHILGFSSVGPQSGDRTAFIDGVSVAAAVPEPSSLLLIGIAGLAGLGLARRRRRFTAA